jgi:hypothetical protein
MTAGVIYPTVGRLVSWSPIIGVFGADHPVSNLSDLDRITKVAIANEGGGHAIAGQLPAAATIDCMAIIGHNLAVGSVFRLYAFSGTGNDPVADAGTIVYDSGETLVWPTGGPIADYRSIRPVMFPAAVSARSFYLILSPSGLTPLQVGGIEFGQIWSLPISFDRQIGMSDDGSDIGLAGGASVTGLASEGRTVNARVDLMAMAITGTKGLDFQKGLDIDRPFVFAENFEDPTTWPRQCMFVRNQSLPAMVGRLYRHDAFPVRLVEHMR